MPFICLECHVAPPLLSSGAGLAINLRKVVKLMTRLELREHARFFASFLERAEMEGQLIGELLRTNKLIKCDWQTVSHSRTETTNAGARGALTEMRMV